MAVEATIAGTDYWFAGEDKSLKFTITNEAGAIQNITGWTIAWRLTRLPEDSTPLLTKPPATRDDANGIVTISVPATDTSTLSSGNYHHTLVRTDSSNIAVLSFGRVILHEIGGQ